MSDCCANCPVAGIDKFVLETYDWSHKSTYFKGCNKGCMKDNKNPNIMCFSKYFAKKYIDFNNLKKFISEHKEEILEEMEEIGWEHY